MASDRAEEYSPSSQEPNWLLPIESLCMDARDFEFPAEPLVVYMFNPFPEPVFAVVLERLRQSLLKNPRPVFIAYRYIEFEGLLPEMWLAGEGCRSGAVGGVSESPRSRVIADILMAQPWNCFTAYEIFVAIGVPHPLRGIRDYRKNDPT